MTTRYNFMELGQTAKHVQQNDPVSTIKINSKKDTTQGMSPKVTYNSNCIIDNSYGSGTLFYASRQI